MILRLKCTKFFPDPTGGAYSAPLDALAGLRGLLLRGRERRRGRGGEGKEVEEMREDGGKKKEGKGEGIAPILLEGIDAPDCRLRPRRPTPPGRCMMDSSSLGARRRLAHVDETNTMQQGR